MDKFIDFNKSVYELCKEDSEITTIMQELGFKEIAQPGMLNTAGRFMTIPKGAAMKGISMDTVKEAFISKGYEIRE